MAFFCFKSCEGTFLACVGDRSFALGRAIKDALRVARAETRLTVYRPLHVALDVCPMLEKVTQTIIMYAGWLSDYL